MSHSIAAKFLVHSLLLVVAYASQACSVEATSLESAELGEVAQAATAGTQRIVSVHSGKALDVVDWSSANGANVQQWTYGGGNNQAWFMTYTRFGIEIKNAHSGKCLDVDGPSSADGANVHQWDCHNGSSQRWQPGSDGRLVNAQTGKCLDVANGSTADGGNIQQWACSGGANQLWATPFN